MFKFGKKKGAAAGDDANLPAVTDGETVDGEAAPKKKKLPLLFIIIPAALLVVGGGGGAAFLLMQPKAEAAEGDHGAAKKGGHAKAEKKGGGHGGGGAGEANPALGVISEGPDGVVFYTLPDLLVNIQAPDGRPTFLKLKLTLEMHDHALAEHLQAEMPRMQDMFQTFLRELRPEDLAGSAGSFQLRAEILRRVNLIAAPGKVDAVLIYSIVDVLLGGRRGTAALRIEGRPYTTIERVLVQRMIEVVLADARAAFEPLTPVHFNLDRLETNPRFAAIARPANAAILVKLRIDMEDRGGRIELLLPYATLEPIRKMLLQQFMGEKFGRDNIWEGHLATELWTTGTEVRAVLDEQQLPLSQVLAFKVGDTLMLNATPDSEISVRAGSIPLTTGRMGRKGQHIAVRVEAPIDVETASSLAKGRR